MGYRWPWLKTRFEHMVRLEETVTVPASIGEAFAYTAAFENIQDWDPGVESSAKRDDDPAHVGQIFDLVTLFKGKPSAMTYETLEIDAPHKVVFRGEGDNLTAIDTITFRETESGTEITYVAELAFKGFVRFLERPLRSSLDALGKAAANGLAKALS